MQVGNAAWREFLKSVLGFTANQLNALLIAAYILLYLGIMAYKYYFISWTWRSVYIFTTLLNGLFSMLQVCLIQGWTMGIDPFWFALGDDAFVDFIGKDYSIFKLFCLFFTILSPSSQVVFSF